MDVQVNVTGVEYGRRYRDTLTDFEGTAVGVWTEATGQVQVSLAYVDTVPKVTWVAAGRLEPVGERRAPGLATAP